MKYTVKLPVVEAWQFSGQIGQRINCEDAPSWVKEAIQEGRIRQHPVLPILLVDNLQGTEEVASGHWIVKDSEGGIWSCDSDYFKENYEPVKE